MPEEGWDRKAITVFVSWFCVAALESVCDSQMWLSAVGILLCICNSVQLTVIVLVDLYTVVCNWLMDLLWRRGFLSATCRCAVQSAIVCFVALP